MNTINPGRRNTSLVLTIVSTLLVAAGVITVSIGLTSHNSYSPGRAQPASPPPIGARHSTTPSPTEKAAFNTTGSLVANIESTGSWLVIPALRVNAPLIPTGAVGPPGIASLTIPQNVHEVGWWDGTVTNGTQTVREQAPRPGQPGVAIIAGHIDSGQPVPGPSTTSRTSSPATPFR